MSVSRGAVPLLVLATTLFAVPASASTTTTPVVFAGGGGGDGGPATEARLSRVPYRVAAGAVGDVYVPDAERHALRKVDGATGIVSTVATIDRPRAAAVAPDGAVYIADFDQVRRVATDGTVTTVLPSAVPSLVNVYVAPDGDLYVMGDAHVRRVENGTVTDVGEFIGAVDAVRDAAGVLYVATGDGVERVDANGVRSTVAAVFHGLVSLALDDDGTLLATEDDGIHAVTTSGDDLVATLPCPGPTEREPAGTFLVACEGEVHRIAADGSADELVAGAPAEVAVGDGLPATAAELKTPNGLAAGPDGTLYVSEYDGGRVRAVAPDGTTATVAGSVSGGYESSGDGGPATDATLARPTQVAVAPDGTLYVADSLEDTVRAVDPADGTIDTVAGTGVPGENGDAGPADGLQLNGPLFLAATASGLDVAEHDNHRVLHVAADGTASRVAGGGTLSGRAAEGQPATSLAIAPDGVARAASGDLLVLAATWLYTVRDGTVVRALPVGAFASRLGLDPAGNPVVQNANRLERLRPDGSVDRVLVDTSQLLDTWAWAWLADGRVVFVENEVVYVTTPTTLAVPAVTGLTVETWVNAPPVARWTPPANAGDAVPIVVVRKGTQAPRGPYDGFNSSDYSLAPNTTQLPFDEDGGVDPDQAYTVAVFLYSPSKDAYSAPAVTTFRRPPGASGLTLSPGNGSLGIAWTRPAAGTTGVVVRIAAGATPPASPSAGSAVYSGTASSVTRTGLASGTTYSVSVFTRNELGSYGLPATGAVTGVTLTAKHSGATVDYQSPVTVSGSVKATGGGALYGWQVQVLGRRRGTTAWSTLGTATTNTVGGFSFVHRPGASTEYQVRTAPHGTTYLGSTASGGTVYVRTRVTSALSRTRFALGGSVVMSGSVAPSHAGQRVVVERYYGGAWHAVGYATLSSSSTYAITFRPGSRGTYTYRVTMPGHTDHSPGSSPGRTFSVV